MFKISDEYKKMLINMVVTFVASFFAVSLAFYLHTPPKVDGFVPPMPPMQNNMQPPSLMGHPYGGPQNMTPPAGEVQHQRFPRQARGEKGMSQPPQQPTSPAAPTMPAGPNPLTPKP